MDHERVPEEERDSNINGQVVQTIRKSERQRRPPGKFTYPQLGQPFICFTQTISDGFNGALVETFE